MEENAIVTAIRQLAAAFEGDGTVRELAFDIGRIADSLEVLADCVRERGSAGIPYFHIRWTDE
jgi:hypothetical protein